MRIEKSDVEFIEFDKRDVILTSGTVGLVQYYWVSNTGVKLFNDSGSDYKLNMPTYIDYDSMSVELIDYTYAQYTVGSETPVKNSTRWNYSTYIDGVLDESEKPYLITDDEIKNRYDDVISWLKGTAVRN